VIRGVLAGLIALGVSCGVDDPMARLEACPDPACQAAALVEAFDAQPEACWAWLAGRDDALVRATLVATLAAHRPEELAGRCELLPQGGAQERCYRQTRRPHLHQRGGKQDTKTARRGAPGPASAALPLPAQPSPQPAPSCPGLEASECAFRSAERRILAMGPAALEESLGLCAHSDHASDCAEHVLELAMPGVPPADAASREDLAEATASAARFRAAGGSLAVGALYEDWFWSLWTVTAMDRAAQPSGALLDHLPAAAHPHLRFAVAWRLLRDEPPGDAPDRAVLRDEALALLDRRPPLADETGPLAPATVVQTRHSWNGSSEAEHAIPAAWCMGGTRRATHPDPAIDLELALLEALARQPKPPAADSFLALAGGEEPEILRWTGARIGAVLDPQAAQARAEELAARESELVLARLRPRERRSPAE
jgi:hypothetical protein